MCETVTAALEDEQMALDAEMTHPGPLPRLAISGFSHAVRNSLNAIGLTLLHAGRTLSREGGGPVVEEIVEHIDLAAVEVDIARRAVLRLTELLGPMKLALGEVDLSGLLCEVAEEERAALSFTARANVEISVDAPERLVAVADAVRLRQALAALVRNGREALPSTGGVVRLRLAVPEAELSSDRVRISIEDTGTGFSEMALQRARYGFFSTKADRLATGVAGAARIAEAHGGGLSLANLPRGGARVELEMQRDGHAAAAPDSGGPALS